MKKYKTLLIVLLIIASIIGIYMYHIKKVKEAEANNYKTVKVKKDNIDVIVNTTATIKASTQIDVKSEVSGKIDSLPYKRGDTIAKGTILAIINDKQQKQDYLSSDASYRSSIAQLEGSSIGKDYQAASCDVAIETKKIALGKSRLLYEQSLQQLQEAKQLGQDQINQYQAALNKAKKDLEKTVTGSRDQDIAQKLMTVQGKEADMEYKKKFFEKQKDLYTKYYISQDDVNKAERDYLMAKNDYEGAKEAYDAAVQGGWEKDIAVYQAALKKAKEDLDVQISQSGNNIADKERSVETSRKDLQNAEADLQKAIVDCMQVAQKEADIKDKQANLDKAKAQRDKDMDSLKKTTIRSPVPAIIIDLPAHVGDLVASQASTAGGTTLMTIADLSELYAEANIDESDLGKINDNQHVKITAKAYNKLSVQGIITNIAPQAKQVQQIPTFNTKIKILLDEIKQSELPPGKTRYNIFFPGMSVNADISVDYKADVLQLPLQAVWEKGGKKYVTIVTTAGGEKKLNDVEITTGISNDLAVEIIKGVSEGDVIKLPDISPSTDAVDW